MNAKEAFNRVNQRFIEQDLSPHYMVKRMIAVAITMDEFEAMRHILQDEFDLQVNDGVKFQNMVEALSVLATKTLELADILHEESTSHNIFYDDMKAIIGKFIENLNDRRDDFESELYEAGPDIKQQIWDDHKILYGESV